MPAPVSEAPRQRSQSDGRARDRNTKGEASYSRADTKQNSRCPDRSLGSVPGPLLLSL